MTLRKYTNNYSNTLNGAITNVATSIIVTDATGLPVITGSEFFHVTLTDSLAFPTKTEIVKVTSVSVNTLTVVRAQEGSTGQAFSDADLVELRATAASFNSPVSPVETLIVAVGDETTAITTGTAKVTFRIPYAFTLSGVRASLTTTSSSGIPTFDINEGGVTILSTKLTVDASETTSTTAAVAAVISDASLADDAEITIDVDVSGTDAAGAKIYLIGNQA